MQLNFYSGRLPGLSSLYEVGARLEEWRDGMRECMPVGVRRLLGQDDEKLEIFLREQGAGASLVGLEKETVLGEFGGPQDPGLADLQRHIKNGKTRVVLRLPPEQVLRRRLRLPVQVRGNLAQVLGFEMDRLTPFDQTQVLFDYRELQTTGDEQLLLELALTRKDRITPWLQALAANKLEVAELSWADAWPRANMLKGQGKRSLGGGRGLFNGLQWLFLLLLIAAVLITPLWQKREVVIDLMSRVDKVKHQVGAVTRMRKQLEEAEQSAHYLIEKKRNAISATDVLLRLTQIVPDDGWVQQMQINGAKVEIRGQSVEATDLIQSLSEEERFRNVSFKSPVVVVRNSDKSRYHIEFTVQPGGGAQ